LKTADFSVNLDELFDFCDAVSTCAKEADKFKADAVRTIGTKLARKTRAKARSLGIKKKTGAYFKRIKRGKIAKERDGSVRIRVYSNAPHAHLIEEGHKKWIHGVDTGEKVEGRKVFIQAAQDFENEFSEAVGQAMDKLFKKL